MYKRRDKNTNFYVLQIAQTKCLIKYIYIKHIWMCDAKWGKIVSN